MWQDRTDVCLLVPLWVRLHSGKGGEIVPSLRMHKWRHLRNHRIKKEKEEGGGGGKRQEWAETPERAEKSREQNCYSSLRGKERKCSLGIGEGTARNPLQTCGAAGLRWCTDKQTCPPTAAWAGGGGGGLHLFYPVSLWMFYRALFWSKIWSLGFKTSLGVLALRKR